MPTETPSVVDVGTNDVRTTRSEELLEKYRRMTKQYKIEKWMLVTS